MLTGDGKANVYADGKMMKPLNGGIWKKAKKYILPGDFRVLAAEITNHMGPIGFKGSFSDGKGLTIPGKKGGWKCTQSKPKGNSWKLISFNDSKWKWARSHRGKHVKGIDRKAHWIHASKKNARKVYCRRVFKRGL